MPRLKRSRPANLPGARQTRLKMFVNRLFQLPLEWTSQQSKLNGPMGRTGCHNNVALITPSGECQAIAVTGQLGADTGEIGGKVVKRLLTVLIRQLVFPAYFDPAHPKPPPSNPNPTLQCTAGKRPALPE